jgi:GNAT superfamily N-acetyltransferase
MIRQFQPGDAEACSALVRSSVETDPSMAPDLRRHLLRLETADAMLERARLFYMAVFAEHSSIFGIGGVDMNEIRLLYVAPGRQRLGIGRALLRHLEGWVPAALFPDIFVYSALSAAGFYRSQGYEPAGEHIIDVDGHPLPTLFMRKPLP